MERRVFKVVRLFDPAIDWDAVRKAGYDEVEYMAWRDIDRLIYRPGASPIAFSYQRLAREARLTMVARATTEEERNVRAFQSGVVEITMPDGRVWRPSDIARAGFVAMDRSDLDALEDGFGIGWADLQEVGALVLMRSDLPLDSAPRFAAPRSSLDAYAAVQRHFAAQNRKDAGQSSTNNEGR